MKNWLALDIYLFRYLRKKNIFLFNKVSWYLFYSWLRRWRAKEGSRRNDGVHRFRNEEPSNRFVRSENARHRSPHECISRGRSFHLQKISWPMPGRWSQSKVRCRCHRCLTTTRHVDFVEKRRECPPTFPFRVVGNFNVTPHRPRRVRQIDWWQFYVKSGTSSLRAISKIFTWLKCGNKLW